MAASKELNLAASKVLTMVGLRGFRLAVEKVDEKVEPLVDSTVVWRVEQLVFSKVGL